MGTENTKALHFIPRAQTLGTAKQAVNWKIFWILIFNIFNLLSVGDELT